MAKQEAVPTKDRLVAAAFELFDERGFDSTTVDDIANRAGVSRTTFFRTYKAKEDVVFPEHDQLLERIDARLTTAGPQTRALALTEAARIVLRHYLAEGDRARARYRLTSAVPALRDREVAGIQQYQQLFARFLREWMADTPNGALRANLVSATVVTAHNHVLRRWLRNQTSSPEQDFDTAMDVALEHFDPPARDETAVVVLRTTTSMDTVVARLHGLLAEEATGT